MNIDELRTALDDAAGQRAPAAPAYEGVVRLGRRFRRSKWLAIVAAVTVAVVVAAGSYSLTRGDARTQRVATASPTTTSSSSSSSTTVSADPPMPAEIQTTLNAWKSFPVNQSPRPLILFDQVNAPAYGFPDEAAKNAYESGQFDVATLLPDMPTTLDGYALITGQRILDRLRTDGGPGPTAATSLTITDVALGSASFATDRGPQSLPAWLVTFAGVTDPSQILAIAPEALFTPPRPGERNPGTSAGGVTLVGARTLKVTFVGKPSGSGPCSSEYELHTYSSDHAVAVVVQELPRQLTTTTTGPVFCAAVGYARELTSTLERPLGERVVVDGSTRTVLAVAS